MLKLLVLGVGSPILPLDPSGRQIGHFRDLKLPVILKASFQNWLVSRILVVGSMCQIIPVRLVRLLYFRVFISDGCKQHWFVSKLKLVSLKIGVVPTRRTVGSADVGELVIFPSFYIRGCKQHWFVSKLKLVSFKIGVGFTRRTLGSADYYYCYY